jgi:hypothetical protein
MRLFKWLLVSIFLTIPAFAGELKEHKKNLNGIVGKIRAKEGEILGLVEKKKKTEDQKEMSEILDGLVKTHKDAQKFQADLDKELEHIRYEHPEEGTDIEREFRSYRLKTLNEYESEGGLDGKLTELKTKVKNKYGEPVSGKPPPTAEPTYKTKRDEQAERDKKRIKLIK